MKPNKNLNIEKNNIMNKTFEAHHKKNYFLDNEYHQNSQILKNNDIKAQTLSLFGINKENNLFDSNNNSFNNGMIFKQPKFELEHIYRDRLFSLYKNKTKEELLNYFIESEINNVLLRKEIEKNKLNKVKLENKIIDLKQENIVLKAKLKNLSDINDDINIKMNNEKNLIKEENNLSLPNSSFVQKELNIKNEFNNMDIDALLINEKKI
jgi:hypothetical protein